MKRIRWNHIYFKYIILLLLTLITYLFVTNTNTYDRPVFDWLKNFKSYKWIQSLKKSYQFNCIKCNEASEDNEGSKELEEIEYKKLSRFDEIPFKTVEDAWSPNNRFLAPYLKAERNTQLLSPKFQVEIASHKIKLP